MRDTPIVDLFAGIPLGMGAGFRVWDVEDMGMGWAGDERAGGVEGDGTVVEELVGRMRS